LPQKNEAAERRIRESFRMQAVCAGLFTGVQVYLLGAGVAVPLCANSAWIASLVCVPAAALFAALAVRRLARGGAARAGLCLLSLCCFLSSVFSCSALVSMAQQSLLPQARGVRIAALTAVFAALTAAGGRGEVRLCFLMRYALPAVLFVSACLQLPEGDLNGLYPILGNGARPLAAAAAVMTAAAVPSLTLLLPPQDLADSRAEREGLPGASFFARRAAAGAAAGSALLFLLCAGNGADSRSEALLFGERLLAPASGGAHQGLFDTAFILALTAACALHAAGMLACAADAAAYAFPRRTARRNALIVMGTAIFCALFAFAALGEAAAPWLALLAAPPALLSLFAGGKNGEETK